MQASTSSSLGLISGTYYFLCNVPLYFVTINHRKSLTQKYKLHMQNLQSTCFCKSRVILLQLDLFSYNQNVISLLFKELYGITSCLLKYLSSIMTLEHKFFLKQNKPHHKTIYLNNNYSFLESRLCMILIMSRTNFYFYVLTMQTGVICNSICCSD